MNTGASVDDDRGQIGLGWVLRNHEGGFFAARSAVKEGSWGVSTVEAVAREGFELAKGLGVGSGVC